MDPQEPELTGDEARNLRFLRRLVTVLTVIMIVGVLTVAVLLVIRLGERPTLSLPDEIALPAGVTAIAVTRTANGLVVLTGDDRVLQYDGSGHLIGEARLTRPAE